MTALFTVASVLSLAILATLALQIDADSRRQEALDDVSGRAGGLSRAVYFDGGRLHLGPLHEDELAVGASFLAVYETDRSGRVRDVAYRSPHNSIDVTGAERRTLIGAVFDEQGGIRSAPGRDGHGLVWAASPVWADDDIGAVVVVGDTTDHHDAAHRRLVVGLVLGSIGLLLVAAVVGHLLSGRAMRPAAEALARQEQFLTEAAHELRTPLTRLRLEVESSDADDGNAATLAGVDRLDRLLNALLTRARVEIGTFEPERIPLRLDQLVEQAVDETTGGARVELHLEPTVITGDPTLLAQAVRNLVDNALRHAATRVQVEVSASTLTVRDDGPGIPEAQRHAVVARGVTSAGTGTGLAIVAWVADLHGAALELEEADGRGLAVTLRFPPTG